ncbi:MAG TPA: MBL fold metallo-hydrolase, partial [Gaiellaceae bacterium]|nr:MBL fold metallo-hydrolase [Gaiellaceae bacterium]
MTTNLTWLGHSAFRIESPGGRRIYVDPFLHGNPRCPESELEPKRCDLIVLTHGHDDHVGDTVTIAERFSCPVVAQVELRGWLSTQGLSEDVSHAMNKGGTVNVEGVKVTMTDANHSSSTFADGQFLYLGEPAGIVL